MIILRHFWLFCLVPLVASSQSFTFADLPWLASPGGTPSVASTNFNTAEYVWIASDLTTNAAISGNWNDRIQGLPWSQGAVANQPTNGSRGIWLDASHWLTNFMVVLGSNVSFGLILTIIDPTGGSDIHPGLLGNNYSGTDGSGRLDLRFNSDAGQYNLSTEIGQATPISIQPGVSKWSTTNAVFDLVYSQIITNSPNVGLWHSYTNGVSMSLGSLDNVQFANGNYFGSTAVQNSSDGNLRFIALNNSRLSSAKLYLNELWVWTNSPPGAVNGNDINAAVLADFHTRARIYYGVFP